MAILSPKTLNKIFSTMMPWSAPHPNDGKLLPLDESTFTRAGYTGVFKKGDFVFVHTKQPNSQDVRPAIYVVEDVSTSPSDRSRQVFWRLVLLGGYGPKVIALYSAPQFSGDPQDHPYIYSAQYFEQCSDGKCLPYPKLNYFVTKLVTGGRTFWDVEERLRS